MYLSDLVSNLILLWVLVPFGPGGLTSFCYKAQAGTGNSMLVDGGDAGGAAAMNLMEEDRVGMFGGRSKRRR